jgi:hypothetical protein
LFPHRRPFIVFSRATTETITSHVVGVQDLCWRCIDKGVDIEASHNHDVIRADRRRELDGGRVQEVRSQICRDSDRIDATDIPECVQSFSRMHQPVRVVEAAISEPLRGL